MMMPLAALPARVQLQAFVQLLSRCLESYRRSLASPEWYAQQIFLLMCQELHNPEQLVFNFS